MNRVLFAGNTKKTFLAQTGGDLPVNFVGYANQFF
jgi:hypothetical protein